MRRTLKPLLFCYLVIEILMLYYAGSHIGFFPLFLEIVFSALVGVVILLGTRFSLDQTFLNLLQGKLSFMDMVSGNFARVLGAVLLILPGVFCDILGLLLLTFSYLVLRQKKNDFDDGIVDVEDVSSQSYEAQGGDRQDLVIGTRGSALALWQAEYVRARLESEMGVKARLQVVKTEGDKILDAPLSKIGGKGLFTKELEEMLLNGSIDLAVHSLKDVPVEIVQGLTLVCITKREDARDCFVSLKYENLEALPVGACVGTTSLRRSMQIKTIRQDLDMHSLRGNIQTRLNKLRSGEFDAIILAQAGLKRLGINGADFPYIVPFDMDVVVPAMGQGALGIETRVDSQILEALRCLNDKETELCVSAERAFVRRLNGGCQVPIGVHASMHEDGMRISAIVGLPDGSQSIKDSIVCGIEDGEREAIWLAEKFLDRGAEEILCKSQNWTF